MLASFWHALHNILFLNVLRLVFVMRQYVATPYSMPSLPLSEVDSMVTSYHLNWTIPASIRAVSFAVFAIDKCEQMRVTRHGQMHMQSLVV